MRPITAELPPRDVQAALAAITSREAVSVHMALHARYARRFNEALAAGLEESEEAVRSLSGCRLHNVFWGSIRRVGPGATRVPPGLRAELARAAGGVYGSGWVCLSLAIDGLFGGEPEQIVQVVPEHDYPWAHAEPLLVLDLWEHAYPTRLLRRQGYVRDLIDLVDYDVVLRRLADHGGSA
jgi:superoxide dismutase